VPSSNQYIYCCQCMIYDNIQVLGVVSIFSISVHVSNKRVVSNVNYNIVSGVNVM